MKLFLLIFIITFVLSLFWFTMANYAPVWVKVVGAVVVFVLGQVIAHAVNNLIT